MNTKIFRVFLFLLVFAFTFILRAHNYEKVPTAAHLDEMLYAWSGLYLVETGVPVSWSTLEYPVRAEFFTGEINYKGGIPKASVTLYKPWLDEPPLFSLLVGSFAHIFGADRAQFVPSTFIRFPIIWISSLVSIIVFFVTKKLSGYWGGLLAMLVYGTVPLFVIASRTAMPENLIALLYLSMIFLLIKFKSTRKFYYIAAIPILAGIGGLAKPTGFLILPLAIFLVFKWLYKSGKSKLAVRYALYLILLTLPFVAAFFAYGVKMDSEIFWRITGIQSSRPTGFSGFAWFMTTPSFSTTTFIDSWYVFGLLASAYYLFKRNIGTKKIVVFGFVYWMIIVAISGGERDLLAWYRFPAFPLLAIITYWGIRDLVKRADLFAGIVLVGFMLGNRTLLVNAFHPNINPVLFRVLFFLLLAPFLLHSVFGGKLTKILSKGLLITIVVVGIYINTTYVYSAFEIECESKTCPIVESNALSTLHFPVFWRFFVR